MSGEDIRHLRFADSWHTRRSGRTPAQDSDTSYLVGSHIAPVDNRRQLAVFHLSGSGSAHHRSVCALCGARQHIPRCHPGAACHIAEQEPPETPQHLHLARGKLNHHRLRRIGRSRIPDSLHRSCHRIDARLMAAHVAEGSDDPCGMRRGGRHSRNFQSPDSR